LADETFEVLLVEFRRVGVDPDTFSAMLALRPEDALRALRSLPDGSGPAAFLDQLRKNGIATPQSDALAARHRRRRDKSA
jgi:hypothetical protein